MLNFELAKKHAYLKPCLSFVALHLTKRLVEASEP